MFEDDGGPAGWTCESSRHGDGATCDCGCGVVDPDCGDADATWCDACGAPGSCALLEEACDEMIAPRDNSSCLDAPSGWTCAGEAFADGECDCGCGTQDPDCPSRDPEVCEDCGEPGACTEGGGCSTLSTLGNERCVNPLCESQLDVHTLTSRAPRFVAPVPFREECATNGSRNPPMSRYQVHTFTVEGDSMDIALSTCDQAHIVDTVLAVYQAEDGSAAPFDPMQPCQNTVAFNDDAGKEGCPVNQNASRLVVEGLVAGEYQIVVSEFGSGTEVLEYELALTCP